MRLPWRGTGGGSSEEHLTVTQFKVQQEQARLAELTEQNRQQEQQAATLGRQIEKIRNQQVDVAAIEKIESARLRWWDIAAGIMTAL